MPDRTIYSFVVDTKYRFTYEGWQLAQSLIRNCGGDPDAVHVQCTPEVGEQQRAIFHRLGCNVHDIARFADGKHCNKLNQLDNLRGVAFDRVVLLDADTLAIGDIRPFLRNDVIMAKPVDAARPSIAVLDEIAAAAGIRKAFKVCPTDWGKDGTYLGNSNGGFYSIPKEFCGVLSNEWRRWALWLLNNIELLSRHRMRQHVDQVSFWLAIEHAGLPFANAPANINFFPYLGGAHHYLDRRRPVALVHYHSTLNRDGLLTLPRGRTAEEKRVLGRVNRQFSSRFDNHVFWNFRYERYPKIGAGPCSNGTNFDAKQKMLTRQGIEQAAGILDIGCGDGKLLKGLSLTHYTGIDISQAALDRAKAARPDLTFQLAPAPNIPAADMVLCLDVLTHQATEADYHALVDFAAGKTRRSLLVSGFPRDFKVIAASPIFFFHEPLEMSLLRTRRFRTIAKVAQRGMVATYRCDV